jgi:hypothetical protein
MATVHNAEPTPFPIYEDTEHIASPEPHTIRNVSLDPKPSFAVSEEILPSIEHDEEDVSEPEPYSSSYTERPPHLESVRSRRASGMTAASLISSLPSEISIASKPVAQPHYGFTPLKERPPFRNASSIRAMQMSSPPPLPNYDPSRELLKGSYKLATPSRSGRSEPPMSAGGSRRSGSHRGAHRRASQEPIAQQHRTTPAPQQHLPLVLLHVTILPVQTPYPPDVMAKAMPTWLVDNFKLLDEKLQDVVLMQRGLLIPHPNDEYDLLEERILESLELKAPRLTKCGHFNGAGDDAEDQDDDDDEDELEVPDEDYGRRSRMSGGTITAEEDGEYQESAVDGAETPVCHECHRQVSKPGKGVGVGKKKWDIKIFAANGLMRAGAWSAAWREMERCDAEISPWIPEDVRKAIEKRIEEEEEARRQKMLYEAEVKRLVDEETARVQKEEAKAEERRRFEEELQRRVEAETLQNKQIEEKSESLRVRIEEKLDERVEEVKETMRMEFEAQSLFESDAVTKRFRALEEEMRALQAIVNPPQQLALEASSHVPEPVHAPPASTHSLQAATGAPQPPAYALQPTQALQQPTHYLQHPSHLEYQPLALEPPPLDTKPVRTRKRRSSFKRARAQEVPLGTILRNYILLSLRDRKNIALVILMAMVAFLAKHADVSQIRIPSSLPRLSIIQPMANVPEAAVMSSVVVTTTATELATTTTTATELAISTATEISVATTTVTEREYHTIEIVQRAPSVVPEQESKSSPGDPIAAPVESQAVPKVQGTTNAEPNDRLNPEKDVDATVDTEPQLDPADASEPSLGSEIEAIIDETVSPSPDTETKPGLQDAEPLTPEHETLPAIEQLTPAPAQDDSEPTPSTQSSMSTSAVDEPASSTPETVEIADVDDATPLDDQEDTATIAKAGTESESELDSSAEDASAASALEEERIDREVEAAAQPAEAEKGTSDEDTPSASSESDNDNIFDRENSIRAVETSVSPSASVSASDSDADSHNESENVPSEGTETETETETEAEAETETEAEAETETEAEAETETEAEAETESDSPAAAPFVKRETSSSSAPDEGQSTPVPETDIGIEIASSAPHGESAVLRSSELVNRVHSPRGSIEISGMKSVFRSERGAMCFPSGDSERVPEGEEEAEAEAGEGEGEEGVEAASTGAGAENPVGGLEVTDAADDMSGQAAAEAEEEEPLQPGSMATALESNTHLSSPARSDSLLDMDINEQSQISSAHVNGALFGETSCPA